MTTVPQPVVDMASRLAHAMNTTLDPMISHPVRLEAYNLLEQAKENLEVAVECGFFMAHRDNEAVVRHLGLQLLEHAIKYKWNDLLVEQKVYIKENVMRLVAEGTLDLLSEHLFVKDKVSRLVVEMIKREWPQQWPGLLDELHQLSQRGPTQTELVLLVFLRIAEDVATLQNLESNQRRRDLYQALAGNMESIFGFFLGLLEENFTEYEKDIALDKKEASQQHCRVVQVVLMTLSVFVEWVSVQHIFSQDAKLLKSLCFFLKHDSLKMEASECLLQIVSRKGKPDERRPLLLLFHKKPMSVIFDAAVNAVSGPLSEGNYRFLKTLTQVLTVLGSQLCGLWGKEVDVKEPENFDIYLKVILTFSCHTSLSIYNYTNTLWGQMFRHHGICKSEAFKSVIPLWIEIAAQKVVKHGYPSKNDSGSCQYSRFDFDSDEDYSHFFYKVRAESLDVIKAASVIAPVTMFSYVEQLLAQQIQKPIDFGPNADKQLCNLFSPSFLEWDAVSQLVESVMGRTVLSDRAKPDAESGVKLLQQCLAYETVDPLILSALLSCISGLFVFVRTVPTMLMDVLNKIFSALTFSLPGQTKDSRSRTVKNVRRHGCSLLVKIARSYPDVLINAFDFMNGVIESLSHNPLELSQMEKVTLSEALILISNQYVNFQKQSNFIGKILKPASDFWLGVRQQFSSPLDFMSFVGLDKAPVEPSENDVNGQNRAQIIFSVNLILAAIKRSEYPSDTDNAERGGFILQRTESGTVMCRNPATPYVLPLLPQLFCLVRLFNALWHQDALARVSTGYAKAQMLPESEKNNILGLNTVTSAAEPYSDLPKVQHPLERMQYFLSMVHDHSYHILGNAGSSLGVEFYQQPHLAEYLIHTSFSNLNLIPDYRIRPIIRTFLKPFIQSCPAEYYRPVLLPVLNHVCPYMLERLSGRWDHLTTIVDCESQEENQDVQEILEDLLIRMLTREYIDLLKAILMSGQRGGTYDVGEVMEADMEVAISTSSNSEALSELGELVLGCDTICQSIVTTILKTLWWQDSVACLKSVGVVGLALKWLSNEGQFLSPQAVNQVLMSILQGLQRHGQHDANQSALLSLGLSVYEMFLPQFPTIREVVLGLPGVTKESLLKFEERLTNINPGMKSTKAEKAKKDGFKKLVCEIVGQNIGQTLKKEVHIKNLPPMFKAPRPKQPSLVETDSDIGLSSLFGSDTNGIFSFSASV